MEAVVPPLPDPVFPTAAPGTLEYTQQLAKAFVASLAIEGKMPQVVLLDSDGTFVFHTVYDKYVDAQFFANGYAGGGAVVAADIKPEQLKSLFIDPNFLIAVLQEFAEKNITPVILSKQSVRALEGIYGSLEYSPGVTVAQHINQRGAIVGPGYKNAGKSLKVRVGEVDIDVPVPVYNNKPGFTKALLEHKVNGVDQDIVVALLDDAEGKSVKDELAAEVGGSAKVANFKGVGGEGVFIDHGERIREKINEQEAERECAEVAFPNDDGAVDAFLVQPVSEKRENSVFMEAMRKAYAEVNVAIMREHDGIGLRAAAERLVWPERARDQADVAYLVEFTRQSFEAMGGAAQVAAVQASDPPLLPPPPVPKTVEGYVQEIAVCAIEEESLARLEAAIALNDAKFVEKISAPAREDGASLLQMSISAGYYKLASKLIEVGADKGQLFGKGQLNIAEILISKMQVDKKAENLNPSADGAYQAKYQEAGKLLSKIAEGEFNIDKALAIALKFSIQNNDSAFFAGLLDLENVKYSNAAAINSAKSAVDIKVKTLQASRSKKDVTAVAGWKGLGTRLNKDLAEAMVREGGLGGSQTALSRALVEKDTVLFAEVLRVLKGNSVDRPDFLREALDKKSNMALVGKAGGALAALGSITALDLAIKTRQYEQAKLLVEADATVDKAALFRILDVENKKPYDLAKQREFSELIKLIFEKINQPIAGEAGQSLVTLSKADFLAKVQSRTEFKYKYSSTVRRLATKVAESFLDQASVVAPSDEIAPAEPLPDTVESLIERIKDGVTNSAITEDKLIEILTLAKNIKPPELPEQQEGDGLLEEGELDEEDILDAPLSLKYKITEAAEAGKKSLLQSSIERGFYKLASELIDLGATGSKEVLDQLLEAEYAKRAELGKKRRPGVAGFFGQLVGQVIGVENVPIEEGYIDSMERVLELVVREKGILDKDLEQELEQLEEPEADPSELVAVTVGEEESQQENPRDNFLIKVAVFAAQYKDPAILSSFLQQKDKTYGAAAVRLAQDQISDKSGVAWKALSDTLVGLVEEGAAPLPEAVENLMDNIKHGSFDLALLAIDSEAAFTLEHPEALVAKMIEEKEAHRGNIVAPDSGALAAIFGGKKKSEVIKENAKKNVAYAKRYQEAKILLRALSEKVSADQAMLSALEWSIENNDRDFCEELLLSGGVQLSDSSTIVEAKAKVDEKVKSLQNSGSTKDRTAVAEWMVLAGDLSKKLGVVQLAQLEKLSTLDPALPPDPAAVLAAIKAMPNGGPLHTALQVGDDDRFAEILRTVQKLIPNLDQLKEVLDLPAEVLGDGEALLNKPRTVFEVLIDAGKYRQAQSLLEAGATAQIEDHDSIFERILDAEYARRDKLGKAKKKSGGVGAENVAATGGAVALMLAVFAQLDGEIDAAIPALAVAAVIDEDAIVAAEPQAPVNPQAEAAAKKAALRDDFLVMAATKAVAKKNPAILQEFLEQGQNYSAEAVQKAQAAIRIEKGAAWPRLRSTLSGRILPGPVLLPTVVPLELAAETVKVPPPATTVVVDAALPVKPKTLAELMGAIEAVLQEGSVEAANSLASEIASVKKPDQEDEDEVDGDEVIQPEQLKAEITKPIMTLGNKTPLQSSIERGFYGLASALIAAEADVAAPVVGGVANATCADLLVSKMTKDRDNHSQSLAKNPGTISAILRPAKKEAVIRGNAALNATYQAKYTKACELLKSLAAKKVALDGPLKAALDWAISKTDSAFFAGLLDQGVQHSNSAAIAAAKAQIDVKVESLQNSGVAKDKAAVEGWVALSADLGRKFAAAQIAELNTLLAGKDSAAALAAVNGMPNGGPLHAALASGDIAHFTTVFEAVKASIKELVHLQEALNRKYKAGTASSNPERTVFEALVDARRYGQAQLLLEAGAVVGEEALGQILNAEYARRDELSKAKKPVVLEAGRVTASKLIETVFINLNAVIGGEAAKGELRDRYLIQVAELAASYRNPDILSAVLGEGVQDYDKQVIDEVRALLVDMPKKDKWMKIDGALTAKIKLNVVDAASTKDASLIHDLVTLRYEERKRTWQQKNKNRLFGGAISFLVTEVPLDSTMKASIEATLANYSLAQKASFLELIVTKTAEYKDPYILRELLNDPEIYGDKPVETIEFVQEAIKTMPTKGVWREVRELLGQKIAEKGVKLLSSVIDKADKAYEVLVGPSADAGEITTPTPPVKLVPDEGGPEVRDPMDPAETALVNPSLVVTADADPDPLDTNLPLLDMGHGPILTGDSPGDGLLTPPAVVDPSKTTGQLVPTLPKGKAPSPKVNTDPLEEEKMAEDYNRILEEKDTTESQIALLADFVSGVEKLYRITIGSDGTLRDEGNKQAWKGMWTDSKGNEYQTTKNGCLSSQEKEALRAFCPEKFTDKVVGDSFDSANPDLDLAKNVSEHFTNPSNLELITAWVKGKSKEFSEIAETDKPSTTLVNRAAKSLQEITASKNVKAAHQAR